MNDGAFTRHVAERLFFTRADLELSLEKAFFEPVEGLIPRDRARYMVAISAIVKFLQANGTPHHLTLELQELELALMELDEGRTRPMLKAASKKRGRPPDSGDIWQARAMASIALQILVEARVDKGEALDRIDQHFGFLGDILLSSHVGTFRGALGKWHQDFVARFGCEARAQDFFDHRAHLISAVCAGINTNDPELVAVDIMRAASLTALRAADADAIDRINKRLSKLTVRKTKSTH
ncbi:MAG: hypothetical protein DCF30_15845 [Hyphomicrobiales bacterium]|nr:MAG: hypothetical protein DCF30_15845 [Hyphomicrobiales bacterium]